MTGMTKLDEAMKQIPYPDQVRWFDRLGRCVCGKPAIGTWRGPGNDSYGTACAKCGDARVKKAERERSIYELATQKMDSP